MQTRRTLLAALLGIFVLHTEGLCLAQPLPGTKPWEDLGDPPSDMVAGIGRFLDREVAASVARRQAKWKRDLTSPAAYEKSVESNRERFRRIIGAVGERVSPVELGYVSAPGSPAKVADAKSYGVYAVRWGVYPGVEAEGLLLEPSGEAKANVVAMADCDVSPEQFVGLASGLAAHAQLARLLAEGGCRVLVPVLLDRSDEFSGNPRVRTTNLTHREWIYRMSFEVGRHVIGYEVDKVRAAVDWFSRAGSERHPMGVVGHGEGGLIALYAAAVDPRIDAAWVSGYFGPREEVWREPVYRNVWGLLDEFGDAEIASLVAPRSLLIDLATGPEVAGPPPPRNGRSDAASGRLTLPAPAGAVAEFERAQRFCGDPRLKRKPMSIQGGDSREQRLSACIWFLSQLGIQESLQPSPDVLPDARGQFDTKARMKRQVQQLVDYTQGLARTSELRRYAYWSKADTSSPTRWNETTEPYREMFWEDVIGRFPRASEPLEARTKVIFDEPGWAGYAVQLPVWPDVVASGVLLLPKDLRPGERRPVVVCQHGLEGKPDQVVNPRLKSVYHSFGAQLADRGYIIYAPQNPYIGHDTFRQLQRRAHPLKKSLFSVIVRQHERTLEWLASLRQVDPERIAFYGLSYGGKTAMRVPALLKGYCLSICSADFNEWVVKCTNIDREYSYMYTIEYDMYEFGLSEGFNYAEMAALIAPRPFQVERGHKDGVAPDEWIGYEYAKVKRLYDTLGIGDRTEIAYFNDGHMIDGKGTFAFLAKHLRWPRGERAP
jgi:dienelactone hydrolase